MSIDAIVEQANLGSMFWAYNYPVQLHRERIDEDDETSTPTGRVHYVGYVPRKERCYNTLEGDDAPIEAGDAEQFIENAITKFKTAIALFEAFRDGHIDDVYYWDLE